MIANRQRRVRVPVRKLERFYRRAMKALDLRTDAASVWLVSDGEIARWNRVYRGKNKATDVLSFEAEPGGGRRRRREGYLGDIAIAPAVARRNARQYGRTLEQELRVLLLHGILHVMGYDHETDDGRMERLERRLRRELGIG